MAGPGSYMVGEEELAEVTEVIKAGHLYRYGQAADASFQHKVFDLEQQFAQYIGTEHAVGVNSGTSALWIALKSLGIGPGDEVLVPAYTFVATYTAVLFTGAVPVLCEIDESLTIDMEDAAQRLTDKTKAIIPVHMLGNPADLNKVQAFAKEKGLQIIEDCAQASGAGYHGKKVGSFGEFGCFSLNYYKTFTAGDGGLLVCSDDRLYHTAFGLHDQGHKPNRMGTEVGHRDMLGMNFRMNELTGAVALAQLRKLDGMTQMLRDKKAQFKLQIGELDGVSFRRLHGDNEECGTLLTMLLETPKRAAEVAQKLNTSTVNHSGWHVYSNMEHIIEAMKPHGYDVRKGAFPRTDNLLERAINLSVGVVDSGLGSGFGINIHSTPEQIEMAAKAVRQAVLS